MIGEIIAGVIGAGVSVLVFALNKQFRTGRRTEAVGANRNIIEDLEQDIDNLQDATVDKKICKIKHKYIDEYFNDVDNKLEEMKENMEKNRKDVQEVKSKLDLLLKHNGIDENNLS